jgi:hypothetical protein
MTIGVFVFLIIAGVLGGLLASIAGLASPVSYPALLLIGIPPVVANVTNTAGLVLSGIGATASSTKELRGEGKTVAGLVALALSAVTTFQPNFAGGCGALARRTKREFCPSPFLLANQSKGNFMPQALRTSSIIWLTSWDNRN